MNEESRRARRVEVKVRLSAIRKRCLIDETIEDELRVVSLQSSIDSRLVPGDL